MTAASTQDAKLKVVVYGNSLAAEFALAHLSKSLRSRISLTHVAPQEPAASDIFYGSVSAPTAYDFFLEVGLDEPILATRSNTAFSFGTRYEDWPGVDKPWTQCFHLPFPIIDALPFHHHLIRLGRSLEPFLISAQAAKKGVFAHPPNDPRSPLSRAEHGYQFSVGDLRALLATQTGHKVNRLSCDVVDIKTDSGQIKSIKLTSGESLSGDLFIDCSGAERALVSALEEATFLSSGEIHALLSSSHNNQLGPARRTITAKSFGWMSRTPLQTREEYLTIYHGDMESDARKALQVDLTAKAHMQTGYLDRAWIGNCVALGQAASAHEPLTSAPMIMLQRDIERLLSLFPVSSEMDVEKREFNRRYRNDVEHANLFTEALLSIDASPDTPYWNERAAKEPSEKLKRKLSQFQNRGILASYDLEPFNQEDWLILHFGMGRTVRHYDRQAERLSKTEIEQTLAGIEKAITLTLSKMPPHHVYMQSMKRYLEKKNYV